MKARLFIRAALAVFCASTFTAYCDSAPEATAWEMPAPMEAPKLPPARTGTESDVSTLKLIYNDIVKQSFFPGAFNMIKDKIDDVTWLVQGLPAGSDCTRAMQAYLDGLSTIPQDNYGNKMAGLLLEAQNSCVDVVSKIDTIWCQMDFMEGFSIKSQTAVIDVDGAELVNLMKGKGAKESLDHIDAVHFNMQGLSKATLRVDVSQQFMKSLTEEITLDKASIRSMVSPGELQDVAASSLSHAKLLTSDLLFSFAPGNVVPSSVVQRRLSPPVGSLAADLTPVPVPSATEACFYEVPKEMLALVPLSAQFNGQELQPPKMISYSFTLGGISPQSECCSKLKGFDAAKTKEELIEGWAAALMPELQNLNGFWLTNTFIPSEAVPVTGISYFAMVDGAMIDEMINKQPIPSPSQKTNQMFDGFERLDFGITHSKAELWLTFKDFFFSKAGFLYTFDETMMKALSKKAGGSFGGFEDHRHMEKVLWQLVSQAPHAAVMIGMAAAAPLAKTGVASQFNVGAVSLVGSLALLAAVAGALTTRSRRQARSIQNVGAAESATELTTQEVA